MYHEGIKHAVTPEGPEIHSNSIYAALKSDVSKSSLAVSWGAERNE